MTEPAWAGRLRALPENWDSYGSGRITEQAIESAKQLERLFKTPPQVVPSVHHGVQLEWHCEGWDVEIEIGSDGRVLGRKGWMERADGQALDTRNTTR